VAALRADDLPVGERVDAAVRERGAHHGEVARGHAQARLARVEVDRLGRVGVEALVALEQPGEALVAVVGLAGRAVDLVVELELAAGEGGEPVVDEPPPLVRVRAGDEARDRDRAGVHHRVRAPVGASLDRLERVEREPGGVHADAPADLLAPELLADEGVEERLGDAHDRQLGIGVAGGVEVPADARDADGEAAGRHAPERRVDVRERPVVVRPVAVVGLGDEPVDEVVRGQVPGRDERRLGSGGGPGSDVHSLPYR
jgi:hypothetical protein